MADNEIQIVVTASDKTGNVIAGITKSLKSVVSSVSNLTSEYVAYGDQVKQLATFTGMQADETSRMIQVADDAFVEFETLRMSMRLMADKGITPNIESLAALSDKYLALEPGLARSTFLLDTFGRAGMEMGKLLEIGSQGLNTMAASVDANLIITDEKLATITRGKQALDGFNDSLAGMRYEMAGKMLDIFTQMPKPVQDFTLAVGALTSSGMLDGLANMFLILNNIGGLKGVIDGMSVALKGLAASQWAAVGPVLAVAAAIVSVGIALYKLWQFMGMILNMIKQLNALGGWAAVSNFLLNITPFGLLSNAMGKPLGKAAGGPVTGGTPYMVGERGPELFVPGSSGSIIPNGRAGGTVIINYQPMVSLADRYELETKMTPIIRNALRGMA